MKSNFQIYKQDPVDNHTNKISLWRSNQKKIIGSYLILELVHRSGSSFGRRRSRRRRHGEEALGQEEKPVQRLSLYVEWRQRLGCITRTSQCITMPLEYEISSMIHEHHEQEVALMGRIGLNLNDVSLDGEDEVDSGVGEETEEEEEIDLRAGLSMVQRKD